MGKNEEIIKVICVITSSVLVPKSQKTLEEIIKIRRNEMYDSASMGCRTVMVVDIVEKSTFKYMTDSWWWNIEIPIMGNI